MISNREAWVGFLEATTLRYMFDFNDSETWSAWKAEVEKWLSDNVPEIKATVICDDRLNGHGDELPKKLAGEVIELDLDNGLITTWSVVGIEGSSVDVVEHHQHLERGNKVNIIQTAIHPQEVPLS